MSQLRIVQNKPVKQNIIAARKVNLPLKCAWEVTNEMQNIRRMKSFEAIIDWSHIWIAGRVPALGFWKRNIKCQIYYNPHTFGYKDSHLTKSPLIFIDVPLPLLLFNLCLNIDRSHVILIKHQVKMNGEIKWKKGQAEMNWKLPHRQKTKSRERRLWCREETTGRPCVKGLLSG